MKVKGTKCICQCSLSCLIVTNNRPQISVTSFTVHIVHRPPQDSAQHGPCSGMQTDKISTLGDYSPLQGEVNRADHSAALPRVECAVSFLLTLNWPKDILNSKGLRGTILPFAWMKGNKIVVHIL